MIDDAVRNTFRFVPDQSGGIGAADADGKSQFGLCTITHLRKHTLLLYISGQQV